MNEAVRDKMRMTLTTLNEVLSTRRVSLVSHALRLDPEVPAQ